MYPDFTNSDEVKSNLDSGYLLWKKVNVGMLLQQPDVLICYVDCIYTIDIHGIRENLQSNTISSAQCYLVRKSSQHSTVLMSRHMLTEFLHFSVRGSMHTSM